MENPEKGPAAASDGRYRARPKVRHSTCQYNLPLRMRNRSSPTRKAPSISDGTNSDGPKSERARPAVDTTSESVFIGYSHLVFNSQNSTMCLEVFSLFPRHASCARHDLRLGDRSHGGIDKTRLAARRAHRPRTKFRG